MTCVTVLEAALSHDWRAQIMGIRLVLVQHGEGRSMQDTTTRAPLDENRPQPRPPWVRMVAIAVAVALIGGILIAAIQGVTNSGADPDPNPGGAAGTNPEPDFSLTDEEAIKRFHELDELRVRAYETADITLVSQFAGSGPFKEQVVGELQRLRKDDVTASPLFKTEELKVTANAPDRVEMRQTVVFDVRFFDESGKDVTEESGRERLVVDWTLEFESDRWLWTEADITNAEPVE